MAELRLGLIGAGIHGARYVEHLARGDVEGARLAALCRRDEAAGREMARAAGARYVREPEDVVADPEVDAIAVVVPPDLHPRIVGACLDAGRPVLVEKPLAASAAEAREMAARAERTGTFAMVAHTLRFDPLIRRMREEVASLGPLRVIALNQRFEPTDRPWIDEPGRGGAILNTGVHGFDLMRFLTGCEVVSIYAEAAAVVTRRTEDEVVAVMRLEPGGVLATLDNARTTQGRSGRIEIAGERGQLRGDHVHRDLHRLEGRHATSLGPIPPAATVAEALRAFVRAVARGEPPPITVHDGLAAVEIAEACRRSVELGRRVDVGAPG